MCIRDRNRGIDMGFKIEVEPNVHVDQNGSDYNPVAVIELMLKDVCRKAVKVLLVLLEVPIQELYLNGLITGRFSHAVQCQAALLSFIRTGTLCDDGIDHG